MMRASRWQPYARAGIALACLIFFTAHTPPIARSQQRPAKQQSLPVLRLDYMSNRSSLAFSLDPASVHSLRDADTVALTNAGLVRVLPNDKVGRDLARWRVTNGGKVYTFTIRPNARFSNGRDVTAADAAFSMERMLSPSSHSGESPGDFGVIRGAREYSAGKTKTLSGVQVMSRKVLRITLTRPAAYFLAVLSLPMADVLDSQVVDGKPTGTPNPQTGFIQGNYLTDTCRGNQGAGPFELVCNDRGSGVRSFYTGTMPMYTLQPNPSYYGTTPRIRIELPAVQNSYKSYLAGELDTTGVDPVYLSQWKGDGREYHQYPSSDVTYLVPNLRIAPFDNVHCRLAVAYGLDRTTIADRVLGGGQRATYAIVPKGMQGYYPGKDNPHFSLARARAEFAQCPSRTIPFKVTYSPGYGQALPGAVRGMLRKVGMNAELNPVSASEYFKILGQSLQKTKTQLVFTNWVQDYPDPYDYFLYVLPPSPQAINGWHDATFNRLIEQAAVALQTRTRTHLYIRAQHRALSQGAIFSVSERIDPFLVRPYVHGLISGEPFIDLVPRSGNWANVSITVH